MKKLNFTILLSIVFTGFLAAQTAADSLSIVSIKWNNEKIRKGVVWKSAQTMLYDSPQSINILEIKPIRKNRLAIGYCVDTLITTSALCNQVNAIAGVNASFFDMQNGGSVDYMKVDGNVIHEGRPNAGLDTDRANAAIIINNNRKLDIVKWRTQELEGDNIMVIGPMLIDNSKTEDFPETSFNTTRHPRTCAAISKRGIILLVTIDGRHEGNADGMSISELAYFLKILGATQAANFDGGGSTAMFVKNRGHNGVVNYPSDNRTFDHEGERRVANVVYVR
jgi:exopolysaccharide biosynthesis protein